MKSSVLFSGLDEDGYEVSKPQRERSRKSDKRSSAYEENELKEIREEIEERSSEEEEEGNTTHEPNTQVRFKKKYQPI